MSKLQYFVYPAVAALALAAASVAHAGEGADYDFKSSGQTGILPAALMAQPAQAAQPAQRAAKLPQVVVRGERLPVVDTASYGYNPLASAKSVLTRAEVRAEMIAAAKNAPFLPNVGGEPVGPYFYASLVETGAATPVVVAQRGAKR